MLDIIALSYISFSEIQKIAPEVTPEWAKNNLTKFHDLLHDLGMDVSIPYDWQVNIRHRNRFNEVVCCDRIVGNELTNKTWTESGYASREAIDKGRRSKLLIDLYRMKGLVQGANESVNEV